MTDGVTNGRNVMLNEKNSAYNEIFYGNEIISQNMH